MTVVKEYAIVFQLKKGNIILLLLMF